MDSFILLAGGSGRRAGGDVNKVYLSLAGKPLITYPLRAIRAFAQSVNVIVVARREDRPLLEEVLSDFADLKARVVLGGATRHRSEAAGLGAIEVGKDDLVGIHDGARPFLTAGLWESCRTTAAMMGGAIPVVEAGQLFRKRGENLEPVLGIVKAQTPQVFSGPELVEAYVRADRVSFDTAETVERFSELTVATVSGDPRNLKVTNPEDFALASSLAGQWSPERWLTG